MRRQPLPRSHDNLGQLFIWWWSGAKGGETSRDAAAPKAVHQLQIFGHVFPGLRGDTSAVACMKKKTRILQQKLYSAMAWGHCGPTRVLQIEHLSLGRLVTVSWRYDCVETATAADVLCGNKRTSDTLTSCSWNSALHGVQRGANQAATEVLTGGMISHQRLSRRPPNL